MCFPLVDEKQNVVCSISWELHGTNEKNITSFVYGNQDIPYNENTSFVNFEDLTEKQVIGWLVDSIGEAHVNAYMQIVAEKIDLIENPKIITPDLPW